MAVTRSHPVGTMLWPLRTHGSHSVYANLSNGPQAHTMPAIQHFDIRKPSGYVQQFSPKHHVEDFRVHNNDLYVLTEKCNNVHDPDEGPHTIGLYRYKGTF